VLGAADVVLEDLGQGLLGVLERGRGVDDVDAAGGPDLGARGGVEAEAGRVTSPASATTRAIACSARSGSRS